MSGSSSTTRTLGMLLGAIVANLHLAHVGREAVERRARGLAVVRARGELEIVSDGGDLVEAVAPAASLHRVAQPRDVGELSAVQVPDNGAGVRLTPGEVVFDPLLPLGIDVGDGPRLGRHRAWPEARGRGRRFQLGVAGGASVAGDQLEEQLLSNRLRRVSRAPGLP